MKRTLHEDSGEDSDSNPAPTARAYKNSVGNSAKFPQQVKKTAEQGFVSKSYSQPDIINDLSGLHQCCPAGVGAKRILNHFKANGDGLIDYTAALACISLCRENVRLKNRDELDTFMLRRFRECIVADVQDPSDAEKVILTMSYNIPGPNGAMKVCRCGFAKAYAVSVKSLDRCSKAHKEDANRLRHRRWTDRTIHDYTYVETEELLRDNVKYTDNDMVRAALMPLADRQQVSVINQQACFSTLTFT
jgi:hypothetical protein